MLLMLLSHSMIFESGSDGLVTPTITLTHTHAHTHRLSGRKNQKDKVVKKKKKTKWATSYTKRYTRLSHLENKIISSDCLEAIYAKRTHKIANQANRYILYIHA